MAADPLRTSKCPVGQECWLEELFRPRRGEQASLGKTRSGRRYCRDVVYTERDINLTACMYHTNFALVESELLRFGAYDLEMDLEENVMHYVLHYMLRVLNDGY